jgi:5-formyltetrahydrofolate cyclo-ligase
MFKEELRQQMRQRKRQFTPQELEELSLPVVARLKERLAEAQTVLAYYSLPDEVNTHQLLDDLLAEGKNVYLPKVLDDETMVWVPYTGSQNLVEGAFHILEPDVTGGRFFCDIADVTKEPSPCYILVPGVAFDAHGHRLGRGRGYYDRFLSSLRTVPSELIGVCFDFQKVPEVPVDEYDIPVDEVI